MDVYDEIRAERQRQDAQWGPKHDDEHDPMEWVDILRQFVDLATVDAKHRKRLVQVAAIAVAAMESYDRLASQGAMSAPGGD